MTVVTMDNLPNNYKIETIFPMIQSTSQIQISKKGIFQAIFERNKNEYQEAHDQFVKYAPSEANAIIGVKVSTATQQFKDKTLLYITYIGTPIICKNSEED